MPNAVDAGTVNHPPINVQDTTATQRSETFTNPAPPNSTAPRRHFEPPSTKPELKLTQCSPGWWKVFLYLAFYAGLRRGEILGLQWQHIRFDILELVVSANTSKGKKDRVVPFTQAIGDILLEWRASQGTAIPLSGEVLPWEHDSLTPLYADWHAIQDAAGIPKGQHYVPKNCRSTCASALIAAGAPTVVVKDILGHATVATTENFYINTAPAVRSAIMARKVEVI